MSFKPADPKDVIDPLRLLQEDLKDDDYEQAIASVKRLTTIALALGPERSRNDLIPYLMSYCEQDNDEAHTAVAQQLGLMVDLIGGPAHVPCLLPVLEKLAGEEECVVREEAVKSLCKLAVALSKAHTKETFVPLIKRLAGGDWFTMRVSATGLFAEAYLNCDSGLQEELRTIFTSLCNDDTPMVRKAAFKNVGKFSTSVGSAHFKSDVLPIVTKISQDDVDSMRVHAIGACVDLASSLDNSDFVPNVMPIVEALQDDASWKVRKGLAEVMPVLCENLGKKDGDKEKLLPIFGKLLTDKEAEVRAAGAKNLAAIAAEIKDKYELMDFVTPLATDQNQNVRSELSKTFGELFTALGKEPSTKTLLPMLQQLSADEAFEVRNNVIKSMDRVAEVVGTSCVASTIMPILVELSKDQKWRVRMAVVEKASFLARTVGLKMFEKKFQGIVVNFLSDHVYSIRETCCIQIGLIVKEFGMSWAAEKLFPVAFQIYDTHTNYLHRMTCLLIIMNCTVGGDAETVEKCFLPLVIDSATDEVANVRLASAKAITVVAGVLDGALVKKKLAPLAENLCNERDSDVCFFAKLAKKKIDSL